MPEPESLFGDYGSSNYLKGDYPEDEEVDDE